MIRSIFELAQGVKYYERGVELYAVPVVGGKAAKRGMKRKWKRAKRGKVEGLSIASRRRLREALASARPVDEGKEYAVIGLCLTIPNPEGVLDDEKATQYAASLDKMFAAWHHRMSKKWPSVGWIWRIELQRSKMPHVHLVGYVPQDDLLKPHVVGEPSDDAVERVVSRWLPLLPDCRSLGYVADDVRFSWKANKYGWGVTPAVAWDAKEAWLSGLKKQGLWKAEADVRAVDAQLLTSRNCIHYLCDHQSKRKQEQLGWKGRQWGIVNRRALSFNASASEAVSAHLFARLVRVLRRCYSSHRYGVPLPSITLAKERPSRRITYIQPRLCGLRGLKPELYTLDLDGLVKGILGGMFEPVGWKPPEPSKPMPSKPSKLVQGELFPGDA